MRTVPAPDPEAGKVFVVAVLSSILCFRQKPAHQANSAVTRALPPGLAAHVLKGREPWSFRKSRRDADATLPVTDPACKPIDYPKPDGVLSFDLLSNLALSGVKHEHDQPAHLKVKDGMEGVASKARAFPELEAGFFLRGAVKKTADNFALFSLWVFLNRSRAAFLMGLPVSHRSRIRRYTKYV